MLSRNRLIGLIVVALIYVRIALIYVHVAMIRVVRVARVALT